MLKTLIKTALAAAVLYAAELTIRARDARRTGRSRTTVGPIDRFDVLDLELCPDGDCTELDVPVLGASASHGYVPALTLVRDRP